MKLEGMNDNWKVC